LRLVRVPVALMGTCYFERSDAKMLEIRVELKYTHSAMCPTLTHSAALELGL
jgi:hypothetical protein